MLFLKKLMMLLLVTVFFTVGVTPVWAANKPAILFIPHDNRPVSFEQTVETLQRRGYELIVPPAQLLGSRDNLGNPDELWNWLYNNAKRADAVVLSSDSLLYGSLVGSRKHNYSAADIEKRTENFAKLRKEHPRLKIYVFGSIMRSPRSGAASGGEEPSYYAKYGTDIFQLTALQDKEEVEGLTRSENLRLERLKRSVPKKALDDWLGRRDKNFKANLKLVDMVRKERFGYLALGRDDNAPFSQTHKESRLLEAQSGDLGVSKFQTVSGIDEMGMVLLTRAVNDMEWSIPFVAVEYASGVGEKTIPSYSDESIGTAIRSHLFAAGAIPVSTAERADLVLLVNTNKDGVTLEANDAANTTAQRENTASFVKLIESNLKKGYQISVADIAFANGADNALLNAMAKKDLLPKLMSYSGWNTANNSAGFAIGQGLLARKMSQDDKNHLLAVRYLDDWAYQANIRQQVAADRFAMQGGQYGNLGKAKRSVVKSTRNKMYEFSNHYLSDFSISSIAVDFPWNRMFEVDVDVVNK